MVLFYQEGWAEKNKQFNEKYGRVLFYTSAGIVYDCLKTGKEYYARSLTIEEITCLMEKTLETGVDHLYEAVKDQPVIPAPEGCWS